MKDFSKNVKTKNVYHFSESYFKDAKQIVDIGYSTFDVSHHEDSSTIHMGDKNFLVSDSLIQKVPMSELYNLLASCYSSKDVRSINEELAMTKISLDSTKKLLESCEIALEEAQAKELEEINETNEYILCGQSIRLERSIIERIFNLFGTNKMFIAMDKNKDLWAFDVEPIIDKRFFSWSCNDLSEFCAIPLKKLKLENVDWTKSVTKISK